MNIASLAPRCAGCSVALAAASGAAAGVVVQFDDGSGLSAEAEFQLLGAGDELMIRLRNTSTSIPTGFDSSDQLLTGISWDFGHVGFNGDVMITGGSVTIGPASQSVNFDAGSFSAGADVSGEWGYGNMDGTGALTNFVSANTAQAIAFGGANLDGPVNIDGPQGGLMSSLASVPLGGLGAVADEVMISLTLSSALTDELEIFGDLGAARVEFGSDAHFITINVPAPGAMAALLITCAGGLRRRR